MLNIRESLFQSEEDYGVVCLLYVVLIERNPIPMNPCNPSIWNIVSPLSLTSLGSGWFQRHHTRSNIACLQFSLTRIPYAFVAI
jgi:hypothetical protein